AMDVGVADYVLKPEAMMKELESYERHLQKDKGGSAEASLKEQIGSAILGICDLLQKKHKHDFKHYKTSTLVRRIQRRMQVLRFSRIEDYLEALHANPNESSRLFKELLINVTSFFRDEDSFEVLRQEVLPAIVRSHIGGDKIRIWVAGCSTGEEAYTFAILFREALEGLENPPEVQIIATDVDESALSTARRGVYPLSISEKVSAKRLSKYFIRKGGRYHVTKEIRELCLFSSHSLVTDPPFAQLDLISCRNVLIYLGPHLQKKLIPVFHYALRGDGYLFLGTSETLTGHAELFKPVSAKHRIGQRKQTAVRSSTAFPMSFGQAYAGHFSEAPQAKDTDIHEVSQRIILDEFAPKYAIVNDEHQIVSVSAGMKTYLEPSAGSFHNNLLRLVRPEMRMALRSALAEAQKNKRKVSNNTSVLQLGKDYQRVGLTVQPMPQLGGESELLMVVFRDMGKVAEASSEEAGGSASVDASLIEQLETELAAARFDLEKTVQDLEAVNEELKSSNEELLSMNEELQSVNEELESSKEEVQTSNEALMLANNDLENLLASTQVATLFLDENLKILNFTPHLARIYNVIPRDRGRWISDITHNAIGMPPFPPYETVKASPEWIEDEILTRDGRSYLRRISVYRNRDRQQRGVVVNFIDVTELRQTEGMFSALTETMLQMVWATTPDGQRLYFNQRWLDYTGLTEKESLEQGLAAV
nr:CheR family methyltransferase [Pseudobdellovibrionaceae bacterium]